jgi:nitrogen fixation/metabolism regulation signal transduction histidine kinase
MQVLLNVLKNSIEAIDFNASEKCITVELGTTETATELKVIDNGAGFDQHTASNLFKRGFTTKKSGTGLGLYNCKVIIESHAGSFEIKSDGIGMGAVTKMKFNIN